MHRTNRRTIYLRSDWILNVLNYASHGITPTQIRHAIQSDFTFTSKTDEELYLAITDALEYVLTIEKPTIETILTLQSKLSPLYPFEFQGLRDSVLKEELEALLNIPEPTPEAIWTFFADFMKLTPLPFANRRVAICLMMHYGTKGNVESYKLMLPDKADNEAFEEALFAYKSSRGTLEAFLEEAMKEV